MSDNPAPDFVYRLITEEDLARILPAGVMPKTDVDRRDGFFHLSCFEQLLETANLYFSAHDKMHGIAFRPNQLGATLGWHPAPGRGAMFPHIDGELNLSQSDHMVHLIRCKGRFQISGETS